MLEGAPSSQHTALDDEDRLSALARSELMDSPTEEVFDRATALASRVLGAPVALLSLVDSNRQFFKSSTGRDTAKMRETPLTHSFCQHVVTSDDALRVNDARTDIRLRDNLAIEADGTVAYLGVPVHDPDGVPLGSLCVSACEPREWKDAELETLRDIVAGVESELRARDALRRVETERARYRAIVDELPIGVAVAEVPSAALVHTNRWGIETLAEEIAADDATDYRGLGAQHQDGSRYRARDYPLVRSAISDETVVAEPMLYRRSDGRVIDLEVSSRRLSRPTDGSAQLAVATFLDVTERNRVEGEARSYRERLARVLAATADPILAANADGTVTFANRAAEGLVRGGTVVGRDLWTTFPDWVGTAVWQAWADAVRSGEPGEAEIDEPRFGTSYEVRIYPQEGETIAFFRDITAERRVAEQRQLLVRELNHRVKNLFAVVSGMIAMTARATRTPTEMGAALRGRIAALSRAHDLIRPAVTMDNAAHSDVSLQTLVASIIDPHIVHAGDHIAIAGPAVTLSASGATNLALIMHELATNAAKYGSLSSPNGHLDVTWEVKNEIVDLDWVESGGPKIEREPTSVGFGSSLIDLSIQRQMRGTVRREFLSGGFRAHITLPLAQLQA